jgi:hypothetical protein
VTLPAWQLPELDRAALHGIAGEYALAVQPHTEACVPGVLVSVLIGFGNAAHRNAYMDVGGDRHHVNENSLLVGPQAIGRKGVAMGIGLRAIENANGDWAACIKRGFGSGEAIVDEVRDRVTAIEDGEEKIVDEGANDKRLLIFEDEFAHVITVTGREGSTSSSHIRNAWDGRRLEARTRTKTVIATGAHISVLAGITREELFRIMPNTDLHNGFLNRFLITAVTRARMLPNPPPIRPDFDSEWADKFGSVLTWTRQDGASRMKRDEAAEALWDRAYREQLSIDRSGLAGAVCSRAEAHTLRLSMLYALLDRSTVIRLEHVQAALALWRYGEASARLVFGDRLGHAVADGILDELRSNGSGEMTKSDAHNLFGRNVRASEIDTGFALLQEARLATVEKKATGGRAAVVIRLAPLSSSNSFSSYSGERNEEQGHIENEKNEESPPLSVLRPNETNEENEGRPFKKRFPAP